MTYRILQISLDNNQVYVRREKEGASRIGGDDRIQYRPEIVRNHFTKMLNVNNTQVDRAVSKSKHIAVNILETIDGTTKQADMIKQREIKRLKSMGYNVLNTR